MLQQLALSIVGLLILVGCSSKKSAPADCSGPTCSGPAEAGYCETATTYPTPVTITGTAQYNARQPFYVTAGNNGLGYADPAAVLHPARTNPIRYAEVRVTNSGGAVVQCAETNATGGFSFTLPLGASTYTVSINSRSKNAFLNASVLNAPTSNQFYSLTTTASSAASASVGTVTALANGDLLGGAFNILDQLLNANEMLRFTNGTCAADFVGAGCANFTVAAKVSAYWKPGFNPNAYFGGTSGLSFYLPGYSRLFILGGINGDTDSSDTDHFDNSVIIHEYGHFLEDTQFATDSPGGSHDGDGVIDPRLAWSEGWGNFIQAAVQDYTAAAAAQSYTPEYIDTDGNSDGVTHMFFHTNLETASSGSDLPAYAGEGNFREFAVTRLLWDVVDTTPAEAAATDNISGKFKEIWASLTGTTGFKTSSNYPFRNVGLLHLTQEHLQSTFGASNWSAIRTINKHDGDESHYGQYVTTGTTCTYSMAAPYQNPTTSLAASDLFTNNRFYHVRISSAGSYTFRLAYTDTSGAGVEKDLDLYLYKKSAGIAQSADILKYSRLSPDANKATPEVETFTLSLGAGDYLLNVNLFTDGSVIANGLTYTLEMNGSQLCPANLVPL